MELTFPFRNWAYNSLLKFFEIDQIESYSQSGESIEQWADGDFDVKFYNDRIPSFENELIQTIDTTTQETINHYFTTLAEDIEYVKSLLNRENLTQVIEEWNEKELVKFEELIAKKSEEYSNHPNRKYEHLETVEDEIKPLSIFGIFEKKKILATNYNYYCIEEKLKHIDIAIIEDYLPFLEEQTALFVETATKYGLPWQEGKIISKASEGLTLKPILFCEGDIDVTLIKKAAELRNKKELLSKLELRHRGSCNNLDKLWAILTDNNWETVPQKKILLYDCDTNRQDDDFGHIHRRTIPKIEGNIIQRGIENLFTETTIRKAIAFKKEFVDFRKIIGTERGVEYEKEETIINKHEKRNFCNWLLENGTPEDFINFDIIFNIIESIC